MRSPDLYVDAHRDTPLDVRWDTYGNDANLPVRIDLYQDGPHGPQLFLNIIDVTSDDGTFAWTPADSGIAYGTHDLRIQVSLVGDPLTFDRSAEGFSVPEDTNSFFVNDSDLTADEYTTSAGSYRNTGRLSNAPKPNPVGILRTYSIGSGDTLYIDTGIYDVFQPFVVSNVDGLGDDEGFTMTGPVDTSRIASIEHAHPSTVAPLIALYDADFVTVEHLTLIGGQHGLLVTDNSSEFTGSYIGAQGNSSDGVRIDGSSHAISLSHIVASNNGGAGIYVAAPIGEVRDSVTFSNAGSGVLLSSPGAVRVEGNRSYSNLDSGIMLSGSSSGAVVGNADLTLGLGNVVYDNADNGISVGGSVVVAGNTVYGHSGINDIGISVGADSTAMRNVVHNSYVGISLPTSNSTAIENRVYGNTIGIRGGDASRNHVYSNLVGIESDGDIHNNLIYGSTEKGIIANANARIINNTLHQSLGEAISVVGTSVTLRNNILSLDNGEGIHVDTVGSDGFVSDYNLFDVSGSAIAGFWQGQPRTGLSDWQRASFSDARSFAGDPLFVSPRGPDGQLGYVSATEDGRDDDFHLASQHGRFTGALAPCDTA